MTEDMPRRVRRHQLHAGQVVDGAAAIALVSVPPRRSGDSTTRSPASSPSGPDGATIQTGVGAIPPIMAALIGADLGIHPRSCRTASSTSSRRASSTASRRTSTDEDGRHVFTLGAEQLRRFLRRPAVELWPVRYVNDPRVIRQRTASCRSTPRCRSTSSASPRPNDDGPTTRRSTGQHAPRAAYSQGGQGFVVLHSTTSADERASCRNSRPAMQYNTKNTVDKVVTSWQIVAELRGRSIHDGRTL